MMKQQAQLCKKGRRKIVIAFDLDGVIADSLQAYLDYFDEKFGIHLSKSKVTKWRLDEVTGLNIQKVLGTFEVVFGDPNRVVPVRGSIECLEKYYKLVGKIPIISHRFGKNGVIGARKWLNKYLKNKYTLTISDPDRKVRIMEKRKYFGLVEDNPNTALEVAKAGFLSIIFDAPYNRSVKHPNIIRVYDWAGLEMVLTHFRSHKKR